MIIDKQVHETVGKFKAIKLTEYPCANWDKPPEPSLKSDFGYCVYSLDDQPDLYRSGSKDPACSRYCPHKAPYKVVNIVTSSLLSKGISKTASICKGIKEAEEYSKELMSG